MLKIRLQRVGKKRQALYRMVVTEHTTKPKGKYLELLGSYNPHSNKANFKAERIRYWLSRGAGMSPTANNLLIKKGVIEGKKVKIKIKTQKTAEAQKGQETQKTTEARKESKAQGVEGVPAVEAQNKAEAQEGIKDSGGDGESTEKNTEAKKEVTEKESS